MSGPLTLSIQPLVLEASHTGQGLLDLQKRCDQTHGLSTGKQKGQKRDERYLPPISGMCWYELIPFFFLTKTNQISCHPGKRGTCHFGHAIGIRHIQKSLSRQLIREGIILYTCPSGVKQDLLQADVSFACIVTTLQKK